MASGTVFVSNFPFATTDEELRERFAPLAEVRSVRIIVDRETGRSRGFAFIEVADADGIDAIIEVLDGSEFKGRRLAASRARGRGTEGGAPRPGGARGDAAGGSAARPAWREPFRHRIVIDWQEESGTYLAAVPDLGVSAQGPTIDAAVRAAQARAASGRESPPDVHDQDEDG